MMFHGNMFNAMTSIAIAGGLCFGTVTAANAARYHHDRGAAHHVRFASLTGTCNDRPGTCASGDTWDGSSWQGSSWQGSSWEGSSWEGTGIGAVRAGHGRLRGRRLSRAPAIRDLAPTLSGKVAEIISSCGSRLISGYRPGARVAGSGRPSLHSVYPARAADLSGNPACIYSHLHSWSGGYSIDYGRVRHVHLSYSPPGSGYLGGHEWHARFAHHGGWHRRYARRHHRYAMR